MCLIQITILTPSKYLFASFPVSLRYYDIKGRYILHDLFASLRVDRLGDDVGYLSVPEQSTNVDKNTTRALCACCGCARVVWIFLYFSFLSSSLLVPARYILKLVGWLFWA